MYAITVDQRGSQTSDDLVPSALEDLGRGWQTSLLLAPERTAGDEFQTLVGDSRAAVEIALHLTRDGRWSVGIGLGEVQSPLPDSVRAARGSALVNARYAVDRAKRSKNGLAVQAVGTGAADAQALLRLLQELRARRSAEGWEVYDLARTRSHPAGDGKPPRDLGRGRLVESASGLSRR